MVSRSEGDICTGGKLVLFYITAVLGAPPVGLALSALVGAHNGTYFLVAALVDSGIVAGLAIAFRAIWQDVLIAAILNIVVGGLLFGALILLLLSSLSN